MSKKILSIRFPMNRMQSVVMEDVQIAKEAKKILVDIHEIFNKVMNFDPKKCDGNRQKF